MFPFNPQPLPIDELDWRILASLIGRANTNLAWYNGLLEAMQNPHVLLSPIATQEAVLSSKIEGTYTTLTEILEFEAGKGETSTERRNDIGEVVNYRTAMFKAEEMLSETPRIHLNMIRQLHSILLSGVRGKDKNPGQFRNDQNYIAKPGAPIKEATYVPPSPEMVRPALDNWIEYINSNTHETLVQLACLHAQFEIIHPFDDGNGRMGRMLIPLYLFQKGLLKQPVFYLSEYFEDNRDAYAGKLNRITTKGDWQGWVEFFLDAIIEQAAKNLTKARNILSLYEQSKQQFQEATHSQFTMKVLDAFFCSPIANSVLLQKHTQINQTTLSFILGKLEKANLIIPIQKGKGRIPNIYAFQKLINMAEGKDISKELHSII
jgi:Fic family protein